MSSIVANQRSAYVNRAMSAARSLADELAALSPAQRAAILATIAAAVGSTVDMVLIAEHPEDEAEAAHILDGVLARCPGERYSWRISNSERQHNCFSIISLLPKEATHD